MRLILTRYVLIRIINKVLNLVYPIDTTIEPSCMQK